MTGLARLDLTNYIPNGLFSHWAEASALLSPPMTVTNTRRGAGGRPLSEQPKTIPRTVYIPHPCFPYFYLMTYYMYRSRLSKATKRG